MANTGKYPTLILMETSRKSRKRVFSQALVFRIKEPILLVMYLEQKVVCSLSSLPWLDAPQLTIQEASAPAYGNLTTAFCAETFHATHCHKMPQLALHHKILRSPISLTRHG